MKLAKLVIAKGNTNKECEDYFKMISANDDVEIYDVDYMQLIQKIPEPKTCDPDCPFCKEEAKT